MTYTIAVAVPRHKLLGVATASRSLAVGAGVLAIRAGVGAVASQAHTNRSLRRWALDGLEAGATPKQLVTELGSVDPQIELRQFAIIDADGEFATHTGSACSSHVATRDATHAVLVGNLLANTSVLDAMLHSYHAHGEATSGAELAARLIASLTAGEDAGGDIRGHQSAAVLVAEDGIGANGLAIDDIDLRVDDHPSPVAELARLLALQVSDG